ncbi:uncharacterized protein LOC113589213 isoform X2 [Electrophorus electricus]|uniref:uncharacterized protein LOC113589213 isoform X2 n=1 Tax=Electrophorus electricus TaxID=8005 RepID=UPI0015D09034|nr:uncharacterized protein LOC113589213 isoform X2 [Electrophorus electricus]
MSSASSENTGLDMDNLIKEFRRTKGGKFYQKSQASCAQANGPLPEDTQGPVPVFPSTQAPPTIPDTRADTSDASSFSGSEERGLDEVLSATIITLSPGLFNPETAQSVAVFQRACDPEESSVPPASDAAARHRPSLALFERVSLRNLTSEVEAHLIQTSRVPSEPMIIVQTQDMPEMIVFQAAPALPGDVAEDACPSLDTDMGAMPDGPESAPGQTMPFTDTEEAVMALIQQCVTFDPVCTEVTADQPEDVPPMPAETSLSAPEHPQNLVPVHRDTAPTIDTDAAVRFETTSSPISVGAADHYPTFSRQSHVTDAVLSPCPPRFLVRTPIPLATSSEESKLTVEITDTHPNSPTAPPADSLVDMYIKRHHSSSAPKQADCTAVLEDLPFPIVPSLEYQTSLVPEMTLVSAQVSCMPAVIQDDPRFHTAQWLSQYQDGVSMVTGNAALAGQPVYGEPENPQQQACAPNYTHKAGYLRLSGATAPVLGAEVSTGPCVDYACPASCGRLCRPGRHDPRGRLRAPVNVPARGLSHLSFPGWQDCGHFCSCHCHPHDRRQSRASPGYLDVPPSANAAPEGETLAPFLPTPSCSVDFVCCHGCCVSANVSRCGQTQRPLLTRYHSAQHKRCSRNELSNVDSSGCAHTCHQGVPESGQEKTRAE